MGTNCIKKLFDFQNKTNETNRIFGPDRPKTINDGTWILGQAQNDKIMAPAYDTVNGASVGAASGRQDAAPYGTVDNAPVGAAFCRPSLADASAKV
jgi:hypothetical protein